MGFTHTLPGGRSLDTHTQKYIKQTPSSDIWCTRLRPKNPSLVKCGFDFELIINLWKFDQEPGKGGRLRGALEAEGGTEAQIPDFGGELDAGLDDEGLLQMCGHARLRLHHEGAENEAERFQV